MQRGDTSSDVGEYADQVLSETREEIAHADGKASILFGVGGVVFGVVAAGLAGDGWRPSELDGWFEAVWWAGAALGAAGLVCLGMAVYPRIKVGRWFFWSRLSRRPPRPSAAAHYFGDLAAHTNLQQARRAAEAGARDRIERTVEQAWALSKLVVSKYRLTKAALLLYALGAICVLVAHLAG